MRKLFIIPLVAWALLGSDSDPITDKLRFELAVAQRDYLLAQQAFDKATENLKRKISEADKACEGVKKSFDIGTFACVEKK